MMRSTPLPAGQTLPRRPRWKAILFGSCLSLIIVSIGLTFLSVFGIVSTFFDSFASSAPTVEEVVVRGEAEAKIAVLPVQGPIGLASKDLGGGLALTNEATFQEMLRKADEDPFVKAIVLDIDSPGGGVVASQKIYDSLKSFSKPIVAAYTGNLAASGAVYISAAADKIVSQPNTITGSIGVIGEFVDLSQLLATYGVKFNTLTTGKFKDIGSPIRPMTEEERAMINGLFAQAYDQFVAAVAEGRHLAVEDVRKLADGRIFSGSQARELGLVDELGNRERAEILAQERAGIQAAQIVKYQVNDPFAPWLGLLQGKLDPVSQLSRLVLERESATGWKLAYRLQ